MVDIRGLARISRALGYAVSDEQLDNLGEGLAEAAGSGAVARYGEDRFVVLREGASLSEDDIKGYVKENLANYKVPREVVFLDELPRNPTGKVLKRELAEDGEASAEKEGAKASSQ